jgi:hypothetical protein
MEGGARVATTARQSRGDNALSSFLHHDPITAPNSCPCHLLHYTGQNMEPQFSPLHANLSEVIQFPETEVGRLTSLCQRLQDNIAKRISNKPVDDDLKKQKAEYNELIDTLHNLQSRPRMDPLQKLPHEIFTRMLLYLSTDPDLFNASLSLKNLFPLVLVSRRWCNFILSEPLLWNTLDLFFDEDRDMLVPMQLQLSRDLPLNLVVPLELPRELHSWDTIRPYLRENSGRIQAIFFVRYNSYDTAAYHQIGAEIRSFLDDLKPLSCLRRLTNVSGYPESGEMYDVQWLSESFRSLKELVHIPFTTNDLQAVNEALHITELTTFDDPCAILPVARTINGLRKVTFRRAELEGTASHDNISWTSQLDWIDLRFWVNTCPTPLSLLGCLPKLVRLEIMDAKLDTLVVILNNIHKLVVLSHFWIFIDLEYTPTLDLNESSIAEAQPDHPILHHVNPSYRNLSVKYLRISITCSPKVTNDHGSEMRGSILEMGVETIAKLLLHAMPKVESFSLSLGREIPIQRLSLSKSLYGHFNGRNLTLTLENIELTPSQKDHIPASVHNLTVYCDKELFFSLSSNFVKYLNISFRSDLSDEDCRKIHDLNVWSVAEYDRSCPDPRFMIDLNAWLALESIHIASNHAHWIQWEKASLAFLRRVSFQTYYPYDFTTGDAATSFIRDIARRPDSYPSLEEIGLYECPEWDILMIMLERRNLLTSPHIQRIKKLSLRDTCPTNIYQIIRTLLRGKWAERPSNWELSMAGNAEIMQDKALYVSLLKVFARLKILIRLLDRDVIYVIGCYVPAITLSTKALTQYPRIMNTEV